METAVILWLFAAAFAASALGGVLGMASGIFIVPILVLLFGVDIQVAVGASLISVIACSCGSAAPFLKERLTNIRLAIVLETATTAGALTGVFLIGIVPTTWLYGLFAVILLLSAYQMLARRREVLDTWQPASRSWATILRLHSSFPDRASGRVTATASAAAYFVRGDIDTAIAGPVALGSVLGSLAGARLLLGLPADKLRIFFVAVLVLLAVQMLASAFGVEIVPGRGG